MGMLMKSHKEVPLFSRYLFWDCRYDSFDYERGRALVIERVLTRGTDEDKRNLFGYYGIDAIKEEVVKFRYLDKLTLNYLSLILKIRMEDFRCYKKAPSTDPFG
jgi:hypothetical protein